MSTEPTHAAFVCKCMLYLVISFPAWTVSNLLSLNPSYTEFIFIDHPSQLSKISERVIRVSPDTMHIFCL